MSSKPGVTISVLTPNYNHGEYLAECIESVWSQDVPPLEHVIIDDASTDNSVQIITDYAKRFPCIQLVRRDKTRGVLSNVKEYLPRLRGSHCINLAADDFLKPGYLRAATEVLARYPHSGMCLASFVSQDETGRTSLPAPTLADRTVYFAPRQSAKALRNTWPHGQAVVRVDALLAAGGLRDQLKWHSDWFAHWVVCLRHGFCYVPVVGSVLRVNSESYSRGRASSERSVVVREIVNALDSAEYRELRKAFRDGNALGHFGWIGLAQVLRSTQKRHLFTLSLVTSAIRQSVWSLVCRIAPRPAKNYVRFLIRLRGRRSSSPDDAQVALRRI